MSEMKECPNCGLTNSAHNSDGYWEIINDYQNLAMKKESMPDLIKLAQLSLGRVVVSVSSSAVPDGHLCYEKDYAHIRNAQMLIDRILEIRECRIDK